MTSYVSIGDSEIDVDSPITESLMTRLRDNPIAITEGASGAPKIQEAAYGAGSINRAALKTATASGTTNVAAQAAATVALTGGTYSWWTCSADPSSSVAAGITIGAGSVAAGSLGLFNTTSSPTPGTALNFYRNERYIQSSPPYDMGDGEVPLFIFGLIDNASGKLGSFEVAADPTWYNHGPTDLTPHLLSVKDGKKIGVRYVKTIGDSGLTPGQCQKLNKKLFSDYVKGIVSDVLTPVEITTEYKNSDMHSHGHPWVYNPPEYFKGKTVVMLDPFCKEMKRFADIYSELGAHYVSELLKDGFSFDNKALKRKGPAGVAIHGIKWKK